MKKVFFLLIMLYLLLGAILIILSDEKPKQVEIITFSQNYYRLLNNQESIDIPIFVSSDQTFFTNDSNISEAYIISQDYEIKVNIKNIRNTKTLISYNNQDYNFYYLEITFDNINMIDTSINLRNALLEIIYTNEVVFQFEIGNLDLLFKEIISSNHLDLMHLFGIINEDSNNNLLLKAICLRFDNLTNQDIFIESININSNLIEVGFSETIYLDKPPLPNTEILELFPDYQSLDWLNTNLDRIKLESNNYLIVPIKHPEETLGINRFPLVIKYVFNNQEYEYILDDFLFFEQNLNLELYDERIQKYEYRYPTS